MKLSGQSIYRVTYKIREIKDMEFAKIVIAFSEREAAAYMDEDDLILRISLVDSDSTIVIPSQYILK